MEALEQAKLEVRGEMEQEFKERIDKETKILMEENKKALEAAVADIKKQTEPPKPEDIQKLLEQEYLSFTLKIPDPRGGAEREFKIRELPQAVEKKFYESVRLKLVPLASEIASLTMNLMEGDAAKKMEHLMDMFEPVLDVLAGAATLALNPFGEEKDITTEWIQDHLSSTRILQIVNAQVEANRMRDFFSFVSRDLRKQIR